MNISTAERAANRPGATHLVWRRATLLGLALLALALGTVNLPYAPRTWFDEGSHLHVPKTLVRHGVYADISSEGFRYYGPTVGVGPTVMLPIAASFQAFGVGLTQGRAVIVVYLLIALGAGYALARRLHGPGVALLALLLLLASRTLRYEGLVEYGRQVLGEVPGIAFLFLGCLAWARAVESRGRAQAALAGLGFGLALVTKNQFVLIVPPALALAALLDWRYYRAGGWWLRIAPAAIACACFGLWTLVQLQFLGPGSFAANLAQTRQAAGGAIFVFDPAATGRAARYIVQPFGFLLLPALAYGLWRCRSRGAAALAELPAVLIPALWICWYLISLGWPRYALPAVAFGALAVARLAVDVVSALQARGRPVAAMAVALYVAVAALVAPLALTARVVLTPDDSAQRMAAYLNTSVPADTVVETWEPELGVLTDHPYHYPPIELLDTAVRGEWLGGASISYDGLAAGPAFVVVGPFGSWVGIYQPDLLQRDYSLEQQIGPYALYRRTAP